jgi:hypothetical protein
MWWYFKNFRPEPLLGYVPKINITYQCSAMFVKLKQKLNSELNVHCFFSTATILPNALLYETRNLLHHLCFVHCRGKKRLDVRGANEALRKVRFVR